jgi:hypothetical protein
MNRAPPTLWPARACAVSSGGGDGDLPLFVLFRSENCRNGTVSGGTIESFSLSFQSHVRKPRLNIMDVSKLYGQTPLMIF